MRNRFNGWIVVVLLALLTVSSGVAFGQVYGDAFAKAGGAPGAWAPEDLPKNLSAPRPYDPHDLTGVWAAPSEKEDPHWLGEHGGQGGTNGPDFWLIRPPLTAWGQEQLDANHPGPNGDNDSFAFGERARIDGYDNDPLTTCDPLGFPHGFNATLASTFEWMEARGGGMGAPDRMVCICNTMSWRTVWMDGRSLPQNPKPAWYGYSVGHWEGDTFVIVSTGYKEESWFDRNGDPRSPEGGFGGALEAHGCRYTGTADDPNGPEDLYETVGGR